MGPPAPGVFNAYQQYKEQVRKKVSSKETKKPTLSVSRVVFERKDLEVVTSERKFLLNRAKRKYFHQDGEGNIAPILPIELTLSVYGNDFLQRY